MIEGEGTEPNNPEQQPSKMTEFVLITMLAHLAAELQVHREVLYTVLEKSPETLQGKTPKEYFDTLVKKQTNQGLAGLSDISPELATLLANVLLPPKA